MSDMENKPLNVKIKIPVLSLGGYLYSTKDATLDTEKRMITTLRFKKGDKEGEGELYTQPYYDVGRYEWFSVGRYLLPLILIITADLSLTVKNGFGLFFGALFIYVYHHYMRGYVAPAIDDSEKEGFFEGLWHKVKNVWYRAKYYILTLAYFICLNIAFFPVESGSYYVKGIVEYTLYMILIYESARSFIGQEWKHFKKVKVTEMIPQYFSIINTDAARSIQRKLQDQLTPKLNIAVVVLVVVSTLFLSYKGILAYKEYEKEQAATAQYIQQSNLDDMKLQSERNGSAQIVITYEPIKLDPETQALHDKLGMKQEYKEVHKTTYPWEKGYQRGGTFIYNPQGNITSYSGGQQ